MNSSRNETSLHELSEACNEKTSECCNDVASGSLLSHSAVR